MSKRDQRQMIWFLSSVTRVKIQLWSAKGNDNRSRDELRWSYFIYIVCRVVCLFLKRNYKLLCQQYFPMKEMCWNCLSKRKGEYPAGRKSKDIKSPAMLHWNINAWHPYILWGARGGIGSNLRTGWLNARLMKSQQ